MTLKKLTSVSNHLTIIKTGLSFAMISLCKTESSMTNKRIMKTTYSKIWMTMNTWCCRNKNLKRLWNPSATSSWLIRRSHQVTTPNSHPRFWQQPTKTPALTWSITLVSSGKQVLSSLAASSNTIRESSCCSNSNLKPICPARLPCTLRLKLPTRRHCRKFWSFYAASIPMNCTSNWEWRIQRQGPHLCIYCWQTLDKSSNRKSSIASRHSESS